MRKEILTVQVDPMSPERGQYSFIQDLLRRVSYDTLSLRERKQKHLAARGSPRGQDGDDELSPLLATHYLDAFKAGPADPDAPELKQRAGAALSRAGERSISLAAAGEAWWYFRQAAELADDPSRRADLLEQAGRAAAQNVEHDTPLPTWRRRSGYSARPGIGDMPLGSRRAWPMCCGGRARSVTRWS